MIKFEEYQNMIMKKAHEVSKAYKVDFDDCVSIGYEIYCNAVTKFNDKKGAKFGTYLFIELNRMVDEVKKDIRHNGYALYSDFDTPDFEYEDNIATPECDLDNTEMMTVAKSTLSFEAYRLLEWIVSYKWRDYSKARVHALPTKKLAIKGCGFNRDVVESAWNECDNFFHTVWKVA